MEGADRKLLPQLYTIQTHRFFHPVQFLFRFGMCSNSNYGHVCLRGNLAHFLEHPAPFHAGKMESNEDNVQNRTALQSLNRLGTGEYYLDVERNEVCNQGRLENKLNQRPRKRLDFYTTFEIFSGTECCTNKLNPRSEDCPYGNELLAEPEIPVAARTILKTLNSGH